MRTEMNNGRIINILGHKVEEDQLKETLRDVVKKRGIEGMLLIDRKMSKKEELLSLVHDDYKYSNVYKYAFV